jgi:hypothetical protein
MLHPSGGVGELPGGSLQIKWMNASEERTLGMWAIERELIRFLERRCRENRCGATLKATLGPSLSAAKSRRAQSTRG